MPKRKRAGTGGTYSEFENQIMDSYEAGQSYEEIAMALGCTVGTVGSVVAYMRIGESDRICCPGRILASTDKLLAAIMSHHPERVSA